MQQATKYVDEFFARLAAEAARSELVEARRLVAEAAEAEVAAVLASRKEIFKVQKARERKEEQERLERDVREEEAQRITQELQTKQEVEANPNTIEEEANREAREESESEQAMRKRLPQFGFQENQIQAVADAEQSKRLGQQVGLTPHIPLQHSPQPTYVKTKREYLDVETLHYYDLPYEYDVDPNYIIILRELSQKEMHILFMHTRRRRSGRNHGKQKDNQVVDDQSKSRAGSKQEAGSEDWVEATDPNERRKVQNKLEKRELREQCASDGQRKLTN